MIVRLDPDAATAGGHQVYIKSSILIRYTSSNTTCFVDVITCRPSATCPGIYERLSSFACFAEHLWSSGYDVSHTR